MCWEYKSGFPISEVSKHICASPTTFLTVLVSYVWNIAVLDDVGLQQNQQHYEGLEMQSREVPPVYSELANTMNARSDYTEIEEIRQKDSRSESSCTIM